MTNGIPPNESFGAVEKKVAYVGYCAIVLTTQSASKIAVLSPARSHEIAAARPHGPAPTIATSTWS